jgi:ketosteroid isomerase-like protein
MSEDWIQKLRGAYTAFSEGDFDAALTYADPDFEFVPPVGAPHRGVEQFRAWMEPDAFDAQTVEPLEFTIKGDKVLVRQRVRARGAGSGIELEAYSWGVWTVGPDGRAVRLQGFLENEEAEARKAAGLPE